MCNLSRGSLREPNNSRKDELQASYDEYVKIERDLARLEGSLQTVFYIEYGRLPGDGNHDGMKDHTPHENSTDN